MSLKLFNTFSGSKEEFVPLETNKVKFYMCGPTVYDLIHIGNARAFIIFDILRRLLRYLGFDVLYVMNLTDIDDKIIKKANEEGASTGEIAEKYSEHFFQDIDALGVERADIHPKATDHLPEIIALISKLIDKDMAYAVGGDVFYDVSKFSNYGTLSGKKTDELLAGARVSVDDKKRNPLDFALWKSAKPDEPEWDSPWGKGRPGWHVECSAMSMKYLGNSFDIHAGGTDLVFPHHENEIAQSEGATGKKFVRFWLHNGYLKIEGDKMAKSLGNFRTVKEILAKYEKVAVRLFFLQKHYRNPIDFTYTGLQAATSASTRLHVFMEKLDRRLKTDQKTAELQKEDCTAAELSTVEFLERMKAELKEAMCDDLNTPVAISRLFDKVREVNKILSKEELTENEMRILAMVKRDIFEVNSFLGIIEEQEVHMDSDVVEGLVTLLIDVRNELREQKLWHLADKIRDRLSENGIVLEDKGAGTEWRYEQ
jgi:cysteinyl-tRNA synthetase